MAVNLSELLALPSEQRLELAEALMESVAPEDLQVLVREFLAGSKRTNEAVEAALRRFEQLNETIERNRAEAREAVLRSDEAWPFPLPDVPQ
ncbi:MAG: hypothetical protein ABI640_21410 [Gammaproteobacteria bacterium]